jgi:RimJ/RimL family protein N-acetyltransferase
MNQARPLAVPDLSDGVVALRAFTDDDRSVLVSFLGDASIRRWYPSAPRPTAEAVAAFIGRCADEADDGTGVSWAVCDAASGQLAGMRSIRYFERRHFTASAGCWLSPASRGKQFGPRSLRLAAAHAFAAWPLGRLQAECSIDNVASYRSLTKAGMRHEGVARGYRTDKHDGRVDQHIFGLLAQDMNSLPPL